MFIDCCKCYCSKELKEGIEILTAKIQKFKPKIAVFNGKGKTAGYIFLYCFKLFLFLLKLVFLPRDAMHPWY